MKLRARHIAVWLYLLTGACSPARDARPLSLDFESDTDLDRLRWHCKTMYARSREHATQGEYALKLDFYPSEYPRFEPLMHEQDWSRYRALCFDVYNPEDAAVTVTLRIDDNITSPAFYDCYINRIQLRPGPNRVTVATGDLKGFKTQRPLQTTAIRKLMLFLTRPDRQYTLYVDNLRLVL